MTQRRGYLGRPSLPSKVCVHTDDELNTFYAHEQQNLLRDRPSRLLEHVKDITFLSRLCFWMAHGTIWQVPAAAKKNAASVCVPRAKHSHAQISAV